MSSADGRARHELLWIVHRHFDAVATPWLDASQPARAFNRCPDSRLVARGPSLAHGLVKEVGK